MAYTLVDSNGYRGAGPTIGGMHDFTATVDAMPKELFPEIVNLIEQGFSDNTEGLTLQCKRMLKRISNKEVRDIISKIARAADGAETYLAIVQ